MPEYIKKFNNTMMVRMHGKTIHETHRKKLLIENYNSQSME